MNLSLTTVITRNAVIPSSSAQCHRAKRLLSALFVALALISVTPPNARAEDINEIFKRVNEFVAQKNYPKAIEELSWAKKEIEKLNSGSLQSYFPDSLGGFIGGQIQVNNVMGISNVERSYSKGKATVKVSLTGGSGGMGGGLAALGQMAAMFGGSPGQESFRINGRTAMLSTQSGSTQLQVFLDSGSMLSFNAGRSGVEGSELRAMAEEFKIDDLDKYLRGQAK